MAKFSTKPSKGLDAVWTLATKSLNLRFSKREDADMTDKPGSITQKAMDSASEKFANMNWRQVYLAPDLTAAEIIATAFGTFHYQIGNGGVLQWWDNGYALQKGPGETSVHVMLAAIASRYRDVDLEVADFIIATGAFIDKIPELERSQGGSRFYYADEDEDEEDEISPLDEHLGSERGLTRRFNSFEEARLLSFFDHIVANHPADENPFDLEFDFEGLPEKSSPTTEISDPNVRYPNVVIELAGQDGNAFSIIGRVQKALRRAGISAAEIDAYTTEAKSGDYDHLLTTTMKWVSHDMESQGSAPGLR